MKMTRRELIKTGAVAAGAAAAGSLVSTSASAQSGSLNAVGATYNLREPILKTFTKRTGIALKPWRNASAQQRVDRLR